ncbi:hypothetical protein JYB87_09315 [Shewanella avicenniae]|uniref:Lipoprotein n=1 Tax=Shewanella avicenniae TaxID=2814294 RepID=A0ABX7QM70_9GAMM|nr:hypothetical protein [Shewanella avicenniae]QSX31993.1 hypothetical protein JYB87_09315 [Shewanella avicenniae]
MKKLLLSIPFIILVTGCTSANVVRVPGEISKASKYGPIDEKATVNDIGIVQYLNEGIDSVRDARREDAYKKMFKLCNGKYEIVGESNSETDPMTFVNKTYNGLVATTVSSTYKYIYFKCS